MQKLLFLLLFLGYSFLSAQPFARIQHPLPSINGMDRSAVAFADIDGDGDQDLLVTGRDETETRISRLYQNDGTGTFSIKNNQSLEGVSSGAVAFADLEGDGDMDLVLTGSNALNTIISKLYINDGLGDFTELTTSPLKGVFGSSVDTGDIDGDGDIDILLTGRDRNARAATLLYLNQGGGIFAEDTTHILVPVERGTGNFADIDGDGDLDVLITGILEARLYRNDGTGAFSEIDSPNIEPVYRSKVAFADVDEDGDQDFILTGLADTINVTLVYQNDGTGVFSPIANPDIVPIDLGNLDVADIDGDGDLDMCISGENEENQRVANVYLNAGDGTFAPTPNELFTGIADGSVSFADIDNDGDTDLLMTGATDNNQPTLQLYRNTTISTTSLAPTPDPSDWDIFPNPADQTVAFVRLAFSYPTTGKLSLSDLQGHVLAEQVFSNLPLTNLPLDLTALPAGIYIVSVQTEAYTSSKKLMIAR